MGSAFMLQCPETLNAIVYKGHVNHCKFGQPLESPNIDTWLHGYYFCYRFYIQS